MGALETQSPHQQEVIMVIENQTKSANYLRIIAVLRELRDQKVITEKEYFRAKSFYRSLTGADIAVAD